MQFFYAQVKKKYNLNTTTMRLILIILNNLMNNEQLVRKLADSYPMRRAAQLLVYFYHKNKETALEFKNLKQLNGLNLVQKLEKIYKELENKKKKLFLRV